MATDKRPFIILTVIWAFSPALVPVLADEPSTPLTVMTYNIGAYSPTIPLGLPQMAQIAQEIKDAQADVVGMTEVDIGTRNGQAPYLDMVAEIDAALTAIDYPMFHYETPTVVYYGGNGVLAIWSRHPIVSTGFAVTWSYYPSLWKVARATIQCAPDTFVHCFMTHYYIGDAIAYQDQTDAVLGYVQSFQGPRTLMGDFNFGPSATYYDQVIAAGLQDACVSAGPCDCLTVGSGAGVPAPLPRVAQIDFIFGTEEISFFDAYVPGSTVSDHWPLVASGLVPPAQPTIDRWPAALTAETIESINAESQAFVVSNSGAGALSYAITDDVDWLDASPAEGTSVNEAHTIAVIYNTAGLLPGHYSATIAISDPNATNSPRTIAVSLTVQPGPLVRPQPGTLVFQDGRKYPDQTVYAGTEDAHILQQRPLHNTGGHDALEACRYDGNDSAHDRSIVVKFTDLDTSSEAGKILQQAVLTLEYFGSRNDPGGAAKTLYIHKLLHDWGEGTKTGIDGEWAGANEVCWTKPFGATGGDNPNWNGTLDAQYADPVALDSVALGGAEDHGPVNFDVTEAVREHLASPSENFGFVIREEQGSESTQNGTRQFRSREYTGEGTGAEVLVRPSLSLTFVHQPPVSIESVATMADHGAAGELGLDVSLAAETLPDDSALVTTEPREEGITKLAVNCDDDVTLPDPPESLVESIVGVSSGDVTAYVVSVTAVGDVITLSLNPLPDQDTYTVTLADAMIAGDNDFMIRALRAEVDNAGVASQAVNALDLSDVRMHFGTDVTVDGNAKYDIILDGSINALDLSECRLHFTHTAP